MRLSASDQGVLAMAGVLKFEAAQRFVQSVQGLSCSDMATWLC